MLGISINNPPTYGRHTVLQKIPRKTFQIKEA